MTGEDFMLLNNIELLQHHDNTPIGCCQELKNNFFVKNTTKNLYNHNAKLYYEKEETITRLVQGQPHTRPLQ